VDKSQPKPTGPESEEPRSGIMARRSLLIRLAAGLAVSVPALRALFEAVPAHADPPHPHCKKFYVTYEGHKCVNGRMIGYYTNRCTYCYYECSTWTDDEGPCC
jgi:hypothetical protein